MKEKHLKLISEPRRGGRRGRLVGRSDARAELPRATLDLLVRARQRVAGRRARTAPVKDARMARSDSFSARTVTLLTASARARVIVVMRDGRESVDHGAMSRSRSLHDLAQTAARLETMHFWMRRVERCILLNLRVDSAVFLDRLAESDSVTFEGRPSGCTWTRSTPHTCCAAPASRPTAGEVDAFAQLDTKGPSRGSSTTTPGRRTPCSSSAGQPRARVRSSSQPDDVSGSSPSITRGLSHGLPPPARGKAHALWHAISPPPT